MSPEGHNSKCGPKPTLILEGHTDTVLSLALSADGRLAVSGSGEDNTLHVWNLDSGECLKAFVEGWPVFRRLLFANH